MEGCKRKCGSHARLGGIGYVNDLRRDLGNGELHAWVEVDHLWPGGFRAVPISNILTSDPIGPPSALYLD